jgi:hypothetical protein
MKLSPKQQEVIDFARSNSNEITKKQAVELLSHYYYTNAGHYVGEILSRLVKTNHLRRMAPGKFKLSSGSVEIKNQTKLF